MQIVLIALLAAAAHAQSDQRPRIYRVLITPGDRGRLNPLFNNYHQNLENPVDSFGFNNEIYRPNTFVPQFQRRYNYVDPSERFRKNEIDNEVLYYNNPEFRRSTNEDNKVIRMANVNNTDGNSDKETRTKLQTQNNNGTINNRSHKDQEIRASQNKSKDIENESKEKPQGDMPKINMRRMKGENEDRWVWDAEPQSKTSTEIIKTDSRAAFTGDSCATGQRKLFGKCITSD